MNKPIIFLDLETTGIDTVKDRIVQIAAVKVSPDFITWDNVRKYLINPEIAIPAEATAVHGITNEMVADKPPFKLMAKSFLSYLEGCNIAGFNILNFDVPLLCEELSRAGFKWDYSGTLFFDSYRIFAEKEKRDLTAAVKFYTGKEHEGAHDAGADILATSQVFIAQLIKYKDLEEMPEEKLAEYCAGGRALDLAGKIILNEQNQPCFSFGKSKGKKVSEDRGLANWMLKSDFTADTKEVVRNILNSLQ